MEVPVIRLAEKFGIRPKQIHKSKGKYILTVGKEKFLLGKSFETRENIISQNAVMKAVEEKGFDNINKFCLSLIGEPFAVQDREIYVLTRFYEYEEIDFSDEITIKKIICELLRFHETACNADFLDSDLVSENMLDKIDKAQNTLKQIRKKILQSKKVSEFDIEFLKNFDRFINNITKCKKLLEENNYLALYAEAVSKKSIYLNKIKKDSFKLLNGKIIFTDFSSCSIGVQANDLALLTLRYLKFNENPKLSFREIACTYKENTNNQFTDILLAHTVFPENYLKNIQLFYSKKRAWIPSSFTNKMGSILAVNDRMEAFTEKIR